MKTRVCFSRKILQTALAGWLLVISATVHMHDLSLEVLHRDQPVFSIGAKTSAIAGGGICMGCLNNRNFCIVGTVTAPVVFQQTYYLPTFDYHPLFSWLRTSHLHDRAPPYLSV